MQFSQQTFTEQLTCAKHRVRWCGYSGKQGRKGLAFGTFILAENKRTRYLLSGQISNRATALAKEMDLMGRQPSHMRCSHRCRKLNSKERFGGFFVSVFGSVCLLVKRNTQTYVRTGGNDFMDQIGGRSKREKTSFKRAKLGRGNESGAQMGSGPLPPLHQRGTEAVWMPVGPGSEVPCGERGCGWFTRGKDMVSLPQMMEKHTYQGTEEKCWAALNSLEICDHWHKPGVSLSTRPQPKDIWQRLETFWVQHGGGENATGQSWVEGRAPAKHTTTHSRQPSQQRSLQLRTSIEPRLGNPDVEWCRICIPIIPRKLRKETVILSGGRSGAMGQSEDLFLPYVFRCLKFCTMSWYYYLNLSKARNKSVIDKWLVGWLKETIGKNKIKAVTLFGYLVLSNIQLQGRLCKGFCRRNTVREAGRSGWGSVQGPDGNDRGWNLSRTEREGADAYVRKW